MERPVTPLVRSIPPAEAEGELAELYAKLAAPEGRVANIFQVQSLSPRTLATHYAFYRELMLGRGPLTRAQRELLAVAVSQANRCHYWIEHHAASFRRAARDEALASAVRDDVHAAPLGHRERALITYAHDLTVAPSANATFQVSRLRAAGFDDAAILRATEIVGYFNFVNRLASGLGVELEEHGP